MSLLKVGLASCFITISAVLSFGSRILCHEMGVTTPGDTTQSSDETPPITWQITESPSGWVYVRVTTEDNTAFQRGERNGATRRLRIIPGKPVADCCHAVELRGTSFIDVLLDIDNPKVNDLSFAEVGDANRRTYTRWIGTSDGCGTPWSLQQTLEVYARLQYSSVGGIPPVRQVSGEYRETIGGQPPNIWGIVDNGGPNDPVEATRTTEYSQSPLYACTTALELVTSCREAPGGEVRTKAPPNAMAPPDIGRSNASFTSGPNLHRLTDMDVTCAAHSP